MIGFISAIQFLVLATFVHSFPGGAPLSHCGDMMPGHHSMPIQTASPFSIKITPCESRSLKVTIVSEKPLHFKGFLIEARTDLEKHEAIGSWRTTRRRTKTIDCFGLTQSAVTHNLHDDSDDDEEDDEDDDDDEEHHHHKHFENISFTWYPPTDFDGKTVYFVSTIVKKYSQIYMNVANSYKWNEDIKIRFPLEKAHNARLMGIKNSKISPVDTLIETTTISSMNLTETLIETTTVSTMNLTTVTTPYSDLVVKKDWFHSKGHDHGRVSGAFNDLLKSTPYTKLKEYYMWLKRADRKSVV